MHSALSFAARLLAELVPLFVLVSTLVYLAVDVLTPERIQRLLGARSSLRGVPLATLFGALTPFCSCSTVPIANGMLRGGADRRQRHGLRFAPSRGAPRALLDAHRRLSYCSERPP